MPPLPPKWIKPQLTRLADEAPTGQVPSIPPPMALCELPVKAAYLDGKLCALNADGVPVLSRLQAAMDQGKTDQLLFFRRVTPDLDLKLSEVHWAKPALVVEVT
jgi:hypothetical protein